MTLTIKRLIFFTGLFFMLSVASCKSEPCKVMPEMYASFNDTESKIRSTTFVVKERLNTSKSSWIIKAEFFSCDKKSGYFIITTKSESYIHMEMPIEVWEEFKVSNSFGGYYNRKIKGNYQLKVKH